MTAPDTRPTTTPEREAFAAAVASPEFSHTRARRWCGVWVVTAYVRDAESPTGVLGVAGLEESEAMPILREHGRTSPLSPTER